MGAANEIARFCNDGNLKETNAHTVAKEIERQVNRNSLGYNEKDFEEREKAIHDLEQKQPLQVANAEDIKKDTEEGFRPELEGPAGGFDFSQIPAIQNVDVENGNLEENFDAFNNTTSNELIDDGNKVTIIDDDQNEQEPKEQDR